MKKFFRSKLLWFFIAIIVLITLSVLWRLNKGSGPLDFVEVEQGDIIKTVDINGAYEPVYYANLSFEISGEVSEIYAQEGQTVKKDEKIIKLDPTDLYYELEAARNSLALAEEDEKLARRNWDDLKPEQKDSYRIATENARDRVASVQAQFRKAYIASPIDGILVDLSSQVGEKVFPGNQVARVIQGTDFHITADVSESDIIKLQNGQQAIVTFDALDVDREFEARLVKIAKEATVIQGVIYYETTFELLETPEELLSGMSADLEVEIEKRESVIYIPEYIVEEDASGAEYVEVILSGSEEEQGVEKKYIQTGLDDSLGNIEVTSGLQAGDKVVIR